jgi:hypothetical protein
VLYLYCSMWCQIIGALSPYGTCSASTDRARVGEPRIFKHAMLHVSYFLPSLALYSRNWDPSTFAFLSRPWSWRSWQTTSIIFILLHELERLLDQLTVARWKQVSLSCDAWRGHCLTGRGDKDTDSGSRYALLLECIRSNGKCYDRWL